MPEKRTIYITFATAAACAAVNGVSFGAESGSIEQRLNELEAQNRALREELTAQKQIIADLQEHDSSRTSSNLERDAEMSEPAFKVGRLHISGEGGVGYFHTGADGQHPDGSFRVDEAKLFLEAPLWEGTYFFGEMDLVIRESNDEFFHLGELYVDFENILRLWTEKPFLSLRVGRIDIPFGEEYLVRDVIDNPLISRSLSDLWGVDEGVELYGSALGFDYVIAVQNGGHPTLQDFEGDKSVAGRIGYNFGNVARLSFSGIRTGDLSTDGDELSELWFGSGFFRGLGDAANAPSFSATVYELDAQAFWKTGHLKLAGGLYDYENFDPTADRSREGQYYYAEVLQQLAPKFYSAARFSQILADDGMPIVGHGDFGKYFFGPLTEDLWRLSLGFGYRWNENLLAKIEYTLERGELLDGTQRDHHDFIGAELGFKF